MKVFIIKYSENEKNVVQIQLFMDILKEQLEQYAVEFMVVNSINFTMNKEKLDKESIVITYNEHNASEDKDKVSFLEKALKEGAEIWPVSFDKDTRIPLGIISKKQSYDIWEQLRCRNLDETYLPIIAMSFARKVISRVFPVFYNECGEIFISHRRLDGEEIAAKIYEKIKIQEEKANPFRDVVKVNVGEEAQAVIDEAMKNSEVFIFIHTAQAEESEWILKELSFAVLRNIPILWIQIGNIHIEKLKIKPCDKPHLQYNLESFEDDHKLTKIVDEILQKAFELIMANSNKIFDYIGEMEKLFGDQLKIKHINKRLYDISVKRKGYRYPQRNIEQYIQIFGRTVTEEDIINLKQELSDFQGDSIIMLSNKVLNSSKKDNIIIESIEDFYYHWSTYLNGMKDNNTMKVGEIVISGAFPDCDEIYKQNLTDALIIFSKAIIQHGYVLTFGAHPTFQELFFQIAKDIEPQNFRDMLKMFISNWFIENDKEKEEYYNENCNLIRSEKKEKLSDSLSLMRKKMIQRQEVKALVCLGGKSKEDKSQEGIREEIELAIKYNIPVFIVGSVGGCSSKVAEEYRNIDWKNLNDASKELNEEFKNSINYFQLVESMLKFINSNNIEK